VTEQQAPSGRRDLRLHLNENTAGCSPAVVAALRAMYREDVATYPRQPALQATVGRWFGVPADWVRLTNGLDEGIQMVAQAGAWHYGASRPSPAEVIVVDPTFEVYELCAEAVGARLVRIGPEPDFRFPTERLLAAITPSTRVIYVTDPNNPTGLGIPAGVVDEIARRAPQALVLVDEAYGDFSGRTLIGPRLERQRNLLVGRTFAKAHGLAGLRIGTLVAHPETISLVCRVQLPFSVNISAMTALAASLADRSYLDWYVSESAASRELIYDFCRRHGFTYWPSEANFVLLRVGEGASAIAERLAERRIFVRDKSDSPGCAGCLRITAGVVAHTRLALAALEDSLAPRPH